MNSESAPVYKLCKRGHERSPENTFKSGGCRICKRINKKNRPKGHKHRSERALEKRAAFFAKSKESPEIRCLTRKKERERYPDWMVAQLLGTDVKSVAPEVLAIKRARLLQKRAMKEAYNALKG